MTLLVRAGRRVVPVEREKFPRFHIGESLLPFSMKAFTRLRLHEKFLRAGFHKELRGEIHGHVFLHWNEVLLQRRRSFANRSRVSGYTPGDLDEVLLDHAGESGMEVHERTLVEAVELPNRGVAPESPQNRWPCVMTSHTAHRAVATSLLFITAVCLTSCASVSHHQFSEPAAGWQTKTGQADVSDG